MKRILFIVNFTSGTGAIRNRLPHILETLSRQGCLVTVFPLIPSKGLVSADVMKEYAAGYDCILCCGGDGTLNHIINEMMEYNVRIPLAYIPSGSTNDFSRSLNNGKNYADSELALAVVNGDDFVYDLGLANGQYFNYVAAFGAFTAVSYETPQDLKNSLGYFAYVLGTLGSLSDNLSYKKHMIIEHDGITEEGDYVFGAVSNSISVGGMQSPFLKDVSLNDGLMEVTLVKAPESLGEFSDIVSDIASGTITHENIHMFKTDHVRFISDEEVAWTLDGEDGGFSTIRDITVVKNAVAVKIPHRKGRK
ncbi:MAG: YegS/Rv2252/BmrU family lipid kinase [Solobacterium sp.]|nr:YegS/Rv2252/BmrU family lipid kinase [Solobacterium sp.]